MKNKTRRALTTCTALAMSAVFLLSGCGKGGEKKNQEPNDAKEPERGEETLEDVSLSWYLRIPEQEDGQMVMDEVNEMLKDIHATLNIKFNDPVAYPEKIKLAISTGEEFDIVFTAANYGYYDYAAKGAFLPLEDLLPVYAPHIWEKVPERLWEALKVDGHIYGIPNSVAAARQTTMNFRKELVEKYDIDTSNLKTVEDMEPILATLKEGEPDKQYILSPPSLTYFDTMNYMGLEGIGSEACPGVIEIDSDKLEVLNQYEHPAFVQLVKTLKSYEEAGYINKDLALIEDRTELMKNGELLASACGNYMPGNEVTNKERYGYEEEYIVVTEPYVNTTSVLGAVQAISVTSQNPERALMLLDKIHSDPELYNTLAYGIEGEHYNLQEDGQIEVIPDSGFNHNVSWMVGDPFIGYMLAGQPADSYEKIMEINERAKISRILGFQFNPEKVQSEISQCATVTDKYLKGFMYGLYDDVDATLAQMNEELRAAGMDAIIAEKQAQLEAWAGNQ